MVVCSKTKAVVQRCFENCKFMGVAAEHGCFYRPKGEQQTK